MYIYIYIYIKLSQRRIIRKLCRGRFKRPKERPIEQPEPGVLRTILYH